MENLDLLPDFDIKIVCRICLDCPLHQVSLWEYENYDENSSKQLSEMLAECTSVNVSYYSVHCNTIFFIIAIINLGMLII